MLFSPGQHIIYCMMTELPCHCLLVGYIVVAMSMYCQGRVLCALGSTGAALMGKFTPPSRPPAKCAARHCIQGDVMTHFAGRREIGVKFPMRAASVDRNSTQLTPLIIFAKKKGATIDGQIFARFGCKLRPNCAEKRDTGGAQNWPRRFAPRPILGGGDVAFSAQCLRHFQANRAKICPSTVAAAYM